jgi:transcriptional regulator with XRE-family HTH domain
MPERAELVVFGRAVRRVREERGVSVDGLATAVGISSTDVEAIEAGRLDPGYHGLRRLPAALGITSTALLLHIEGDGIDLDPRAVSVAFGQRLSELCGEYGVSKRELARRTGLHTTAIRRFERGAREPRLTSILSLARGLGVKPGALVDGLRVEKSDDDAQAEGEA